MQVHLRLKAVGNAPRLNDGADLSIEASSTWREVCVLVNAKIKGAGRLSDQSPLHVYLSGLAGGVPFKPVDEQLVCDLADCFGLPSTSPEPSGVTLVVSYSIAAAY